MQAIEWCHFRRLWVTPDPGFKVTVVLKGEYLENGAFYTQSYYGTVIGNHMQAIEWCHFRWPWVTPAPGFKVTVVLKGEYIQSNAFYRHSYYIGRKYRHAVDRQASYIQLTTPVLLRKPCKLFASVARVCQRQLGFLVIGWCPSCHPINSVKALKHWRHICHTANMLYISLVKYRIASYKLGTGLTWSNSWKVGR